MAADRRMTHDPRRLEAVGQRPVASFRVRPRAVFGWLVAVTAILTVLSIAGQLLVRWAPDFPFRDTLAKVFSVDAEKNVPTLFSVTLLFAAAALFALVARSSSDHVLERGGRWLAGIFVVLGVDEFVMLHERATPVVRRILGIHGGPLWFAWVVPAFALVVLVGLAVTPFVARLDRRVRWLLALAVFLYVGGAIGVELINGALAAADGRTSLWYVTFTTVEEAMEMLGVSVAILALLTHLATRGPRPFWQVHLEPSGSLEREARSAGRG